MEGGWKGAGGTFVLFCDFYTSTDVWGYLLEVGTCIGAFFFHLSLYLGSGGFAYYYWNFKGLALREIFLALSCEKFVLFVRVLLGLFMFFKLLGLQIWFYFLFSMCVWVIGGMVKLQCSIL